jgi:hypothetical protein
LTIAADGTNLGTTHRPPKLQLSASTFVRPKCICHAGACHKFGVSRDRARLTGGVVIDQSAKLSAPVFGLL